MSILLDKPRPKGFSPKREKRLCNLFNNEGRDFLVRAKKNIKILKKLEISEVLKKFLKSF